MPSGALATRRIGKMMAEHLGGNLISLLGYLKTQYPQGKANGAGRIADENRGGREAKGRSRSASVIPKRTALMKICAYASRADGEHRLPIAQR